MSIGWQPQPTNVGGDLTGTTDSAVVVGIQTRPVDATAPTPGQIYAWSGTSWVPATLAGGGPEPMGGDVTGITSAATVVAIQTVAIDPSAPLTGDVLSFDGAAWAPLDVGTVAIAGDVTGTLAASSVVAVDGQPVTPATSTIYVDPNGDALSSGRYPTSPTTFAAAVAAAVSGTLIVLAAGAYSPPTISVNGLNVIGLSEQSSAAASAAVRFTTGLTITASNVRFAGIQLDTVTELSSVAGTTVFEQCTIQSTTTITDSAGLTLSLISTTFANIVVNGTNTTTVLRLRSCPGGGTITNATTGLVTTIAENSNFVSVTQTAAGQQAIELNGCYLSGGITRSAGSTITVILRASFLVGAIDATGAAAGTVQIIASVFDRAGSTLPVGAEAGVVTRDTELEYNTDAPDFWVGGDPATVKLALDQIVQGDFSYGATPSYWLDADVSTSVTVGPPPTFTGSVSYLASGLVSIKAGIYLFIVSAFFEVSNNNTQVYWDLWLNGAPSATGFSAFSMGLAGAADTRTACVWIYIPVDASATMDLRFGRYGGTGSVTLHNAGYLLIRIGNFP